jgi:formylglycine-generating enzyme required for sulfatase activity
MKLEKLFLLWMLLGLITDTSAQEATMRGLTLNTKAGLLWSGFVTENNERVSLKEASTLFSFCINDSIVLSSDLVVNERNDSIDFVHGDYLEGSFKPVDNKKGFHATLRFRNKTQRILKISNVVPLGQGANRVYITGAGGYEWPYFLNRSQLFRPGYGPIGVVLPDNAWHLGFADQQVKDDWLLAGLARRKSLSNANKTRWHAELQPGGEVVYNLWFQCHKGDWQQGLKIMFQDRWLYDLEKFDNKLFERQDLQWVRHAFINLLQFAWDQTYYDAEQERHYYDQTLFKRDKQLGGYDIFTLWPTWPRLGLDPRNQFDLYRDLPGGISELKRQASVAHMYGKKYFISYNPWDADTRKEDHLQGLGKLLKEIDADGVVLDTRGESAKELQEMADGVKPGIIMYSEGMAVPANMPGIVSGRVHDALYMPPPLNLNKFIKPDFAIFRVLQLADGEIHREAAISFFNGYGVEINAMRPGRPDWIDRDFSFLGQTTKILRDNASVFFEKTWIPLLPTLCDSVYVNQWQHNHKTVFTVFSLKPDGYTGLLFELPPSLYTKDYHYVSLWNHNEIEPALHGGKPYLPVDLACFNRNWLGTRKEGETECVAVFPNLLNVELMGDSLSFSGKEGNHIVVYPGNPSYSLRKADFEAYANKISVYEHFGRYEGKLVLQLFDDTELLDERILYIKQGLPRLVSYKAEITSENPPTDDVVKIPSGLYKFVSKRALGATEPFVQYPLHHDTTLQYIQGFFMDKYPVTNQQFFDFVTQSGYVPTDTANFLRHWVSGRIPVGYEEHPVVFVSYQDAQAYAKWAKKRLPTEREWQYAAQGPHSYDWPWGNTFDSSLCNYNLNHSTPVNSFPKGENEWGLADLVGNVWQMTNDLYDDGAYYYVIMKGGSHYSPKSSQWYVEGGPQPVYHPQLLLMVSAGFDRSSTVGFRCVRDFKK